jgi:hydroxyacylglutathione hydrolase
MNIKTFTFNPFAENTYVLYDNSNAAVIVDPGCSTPAEVKELTDFIEKEGLKVVKVLNTHGHIDHVLGNYAITNKYNVALATHKKDLDTLRSVVAYAPSYGFANYHEQLPSEWLSEGEPFTFGNTTLEIRFAPGHAPGHTVFYHAASKACIGGDVLFNRSIGRTDLPGGDYETLIKSIHEQLFTLPDDTVVYPGHGPTTTIGEEKKLNPFCALR